MIPRKLQKGQQFKAATVDKINEIIDYLQTQKIVGDNKTIKVSQLTSGVGLTVLNQSGSKQSSAAAPFDYLYKLSIENTETANYLTVNSLYSHTSGDNHYQKQIDLKSITEDGRYRVKCYMTQHPERGLFDNGWTVFITPSKFHTGEGNQPNVRGIFTFQLGEIERVTTTQTAEDGTEKEIITYEVKSQDTVGWVQYQDSMPDTAFAVYVQFATPPADGEYIPQAFTMANFKLFVNKGEIYFGDDAREINSKTLDMPSAGEGESISQAFVNLAVDDVNHSCTMTLEKEKKSYIEDKDGQKIKNYTLAMLQANPYGYSDDYWVLHQYIGTNIYFNDDAKVGVSQGDPEPSYLLDKLTSENDSITIESFTDDNGFQMVNIEADIFDIVSEDGSINVSDTTLPDGTPAKNIECNIEVTAGADILVTENDHNFTIAVDDTNFIKQVLGGKNCSVSKNGTTVTVDVDDCHIPISGTAPISVTGSSKNGYTITFNKSSFVETINGGTYISVTHPAGTTTRNLSLDIDAVLNCLNAGTGITITGTGASRTITCTAAGLTVGSSARAVLAIDTNSNPPELKASANIPADISIICGYQGNLTYWNSQGYNNFSMPVLSRNATTFRWIEGGYCSVSSSDTSPGYLVDKIKVAGDAEGVFKFEDYTTELIFKVTKPTTSKLPVISHNGTNVIWSDAAVVSVNSSDNAPSYLADKLTSEDGSVTFTVKDGKLDLSSGGGKVQCTSNDTADFLSSKLSSDGSISITVDGSGTQTMKLSINPDYFTSSDSSIIITKTDTGIDLTSAGMVKIDASDVNGYLADKFTSSDQTITIEKKDGKLDLKSLGGGKVKVSENDPQAGWLYDKIYSTNLSIQRGYLDGAFEQVDLTINPSYFISSDGSIDIQQADDGISLDFISNGMVKCSQSDVTSYLENKLQSQKLHLLFETKSNGAAETIDISISPTAFTSSDQSVTISEAEGGQIDLTGAGKVQVNADDTAGFLNEKLTSDDNSIIVVDNGSAMDLAVNPDIFYSSDDSIIVEATDQGIDFTGTGKVKVSENDENGYLGSKFENNDLINFQVSDTQISAELGGNAIISSDASIQVNITNGFADIKANGKVKCTANDTPDFLNSKINVDASISGLITLDKQANQILIKSALTGSGLLLVENGQIKPLPAPAGKAVLAVDNGSFVWLPYADCENACQSE